MGTEPISAAQEIVTLGTVPLIMEALQRTVNADPSLLGTKHTGTQFGSCCSTSGYSGSTKDYCSPPNCYSGACLTSGYTSTNGECGPNFTGNMTCPGSLAIVVLSVDIAGTPALTARAQIAIVVLVLLRSIIR